MNEWRVIIKGETKPDITTAHEVQIHGYEFALANAVPCWEVALGTADIQVI